MWFLFAGIKASLLFFTFPYMEVHLQQMMDDMCNTTRVRNTYEVNFFSFQFVFARSIHFNTESQSFYCLEHARIQRQQSHKTKLIGPKPHAPESKVWFNLGITMIVHFTFSLGWWNDIFLKEQSQKTNMKSVDTETLYAHVHTQRTFLSFFVV